MHDLCALQHQLTLFAMRLLLRDTQDMLAHTVVQPKAGCCNPSCCRSCGAPVLLTSLHHHLSEQPPPSTHTHTTSACPMLSPTHVALPEPRHALMLVHPQRCLQRRPAAGLEHLQATTQWWSALHQLHGLRFRKYSLSSMGFCPTVMVVSPVAKAPKQRVEHFDGC
jgi:hypothetical protein